MSQSMVVQRVVTSQSNRVVNRLKGEYAKQQAYITLIPIWSLQRN